jgi:hypothetical protein
VLLIQISTSNKERVVISNFKNTAVLAGLSAAALLMGGCVAAKNPITQGKGVKDPVRLENPQNIKDIYAGTYSYIFAEDATTTWVEFGKVTDHPDSLNKRLAPTLRAYDMCKANGGNPVIGKDFFKSSTWNRHPWMHRDNLNRLDAIIAEQVKIGADDQGKELVCSGGSDPFVAEAFDSTFRITHEKPQEQGYAMRAFEEWGKTLSFEDFEGDGWVFDRVNSRGSIWAYAYCHGRGGEYLVSSRPTSGKAIPLQEYMINSLLEKTPMDMPSEYWRESKLYCVGTDDRNDEFTGTVEYKNGWPIVHFKKGVNRSEVVR